MKRGKDKKGLPFFGIPKLAPYLKPYKMLFFWMVVTGTVGSGMDAIIPLFQQHAIDHFIADKTMQGVGGWLALYILVMIIQTATNYISAYGACKAELYIGRDLKRETFNHLQTLSFSYFNQNSVGYTHARVMSDTDRIASTLAWGLMEAVWYIAYLLLAIVMMFVLMVMGGLMVVRVLVVMRVSEVAIMAVMLVILILFLAVYLNGHMSSGNTAFYGRFFFVADAWNIERVKFIQKFILIGQQFNKGGGEHIAGCAH